MNAEVITEIEHARKMGADIPVWMEPHPRGFISDGVLPSAQEIAGSSQTKRNRLFEGRRTEIEAASRPAAAAYARYEADVIRAYKEGQFNILTPGLHPDAATIITSHESAKLHRRALLYAQLLSTAEAAPAVLQIGARVCTRHHRLSSDARTTLACTGEVLEVHGEYVVVAFDDLTQALFPAKDLRRSREVCSMEAREKLREMSL